MQTPPDSRSLAPPYWSGHGTFPESVVASFSEPDQFAAAIRPADVQLTVTQRGTYTAQFAAINVGRLALREFQANLAVVGHTALSPDYVVLSFLLDPAGAMHIAGHELDGDTMIQHAAGRACYQRTFGPTRLAHMLLPQPLLESVAANAAHVRRTPDKSHFGTPPAPALLRLRHLQNAVIRLAQAKPAVLAHKRAAHGLEQALMESISECFSGGDLHSVPLTYRKREAVMQRFQRLLDANPTGSLFIPEICDMLGVSARTLRLCCIEHLGMGPKRFLLLRRMHLVRGALLAATPFEKSVTAVAIEYGFWELGRFAVAYKALFGESPSVTLHNPVRAAVWPVAPDFAAAKRRLN